MRAALQASFRRRRGKCGGFFRQFAPGYGAPDAAALFANGRTFTPFPGVMHEQFWKSIQVETPNCHLPRSSEPPQPPWRAERAGRNHPQNVGMQSSDAPQSARTGKKTYETCAARAGMAHGVCTHIVLCKNGRDV